VTFSRGARLGPYEIIFRLGAGGMGVVNRAKDPRLRRNVALKVVPEDLRANRRERGRRVRILSLGT
jgi:serine/threonine-protein kinase